ncbi:5-oxoprolinase subunit PxpB [Formosa sediminum]|uniref:5-oxoprolinase subunit PxpB n=1 Tax=Formosa sediminum TaxID=2594004 RepID=A0A516GTP8_9FLAO|nr:5-oxoprolinase subunit PxpB [Formosa sediminum]QDO94888.1 5-oxoprolinase subunit PxpB [Formosa sediminum]
MAFKLSYKAYGAHAILIEWPKQISESILDDLLKFKATLETSELRNIQDIRSAYQTLLIVYNTPIIFKKETEYLKHLYTSVNSHQTITTNIWSIPVCYNDMFGLDLQVISDSKSISKTEIIKRHSEPTYTVYGIGFLPGFLYLGGLDPILEMPRQSTPRPRIEKGSVAIGGQQTGIYPSDSPGGWNILGKTPLSFFNPTLEKPCFAQPGDRIQFYSISLQEFETITALVEADSYDIKRRSYHD